MKTFFEEDLEYFSGQSDQAGYWDYSLIDSNPSNGYEVSYSESDEEWYGHILSNVTPEGDFTVVRDLDADEIEFCVGLIPVDELPSVLLKTKLDEALARNAELETLLTKCKGNK